MSVDYSAPAELYSFPNRGERGSPVYRKFASMAEALRFAVETPPKGASRSLIESNEQRFERADLRALYDSEAYPLRRKGE